MDLSGLAAVNNVSDLNTWITDNCLTPIRPAMSGTDIGAILNKTVTIVEATVTAESTTRATADTTEATTRGTADTTLQTNITSEAATRAAADTTLQTNINAKQNTLGFTPENAANKNAANGYAGLDSGGLLLASQWPAGIDKVVEYANLAAFPGTGASSIIYLALDTSKQYRWSGSTYIQIVATPGTTDAVTEGTINLYFTISRVLSTVLAGISFATATAVLSTDSILIAIGKLQAQLNQGYLLLTGGSLSGQLNINNSALALLGSNTTTSPSSYLTSAGLKVGSSGNLTHGYMGFNNGNITLDDGTTLFIVNMPAKNGTFALTSDVIASAKINYNFYQSVL